LNDLKTNASISGLSSNVFVLKSLEYKAQALNLAYQKTKELDFLESSYSTYDLAIDFVDKLRFGYKREGSKQTLAERSQTIFEGAIGVALEINRTTGKKEYIGHALDFAERNKSFVLLENLKDKRAKAFASISPGLLEQEEKVAEEIAMYERFILEEEHGAKQPDSSKLQYWHLKLLELRNEQDSVIAILEKKHPDYYRLKYDTHIATPSEVQRHLHKNTALLEYFPGDSTLYLFTITKDGAFCHTAPLPEDFYQKIDSLRHLAGDNPIALSELQRKERHQQFVSLSRELYRLLLEPALSRVKARELIIIPGGPLGYLPFHLLLTEDPDEEKMASFDYRNLPYLFRKYTTRFEFSATVMMQDWGNRKTTTSYAGYAPQYEGDELIASRSAEDSLHIARLYATTARDGLSALPGNVPEVEAAAAEMGGIAHKGTEALESNFKKEAPNCRILHLAMHALTNDEEPLYSQLIFSKEPDTAEDGKLHVYELYNMHLNADLAVLSACNTGVGKIQRGEGIMSLSRAFKYAGCPNIVTSLWKAGDLATKEIMTSFFKNLKAGMGKDEALRTARKDFLINAPSEMMHPYFWGTFVLIGDGEPVVSGSLGWLLWVGAFLLGGLVIWGFRYRFRFPEF
jgi:CHAT domain-containing protein